jgi:hypothetical protein
MHGAAAGHQEHVLDVQLLHELNDVIGEFHVSFYAV